MSQPGNQMFPVLHVGVRGNVVPVAGAGGANMSSSSSSGDKSEHDASFDAGGVSRRHVIQLSKKIGISRSSIASEEDGHRDEDDISNANDNYECEDDTEYKSQDNDDHYEAQSKYGDEGEDEDEED